MPFLLDHKRPAIPGYLTEDSTLGDFLKWAQTQLPEGRVVTQVRLDEQILEGPALHAARRNPLASSTLALTTADRKELSLTTLGKLAALIQWLAPQHQQIASALERGEISAGLQRLQGVISAWQQIQSAYANLAKLLLLDLSELPVREITGEAALQDFCHQLGEIQTALQNRDFVLLADILQYEMDGARETWMALLQSTLGVVDPAAACTA